MKKSPAILSILALLLFTLFTRCKEDTTTEVIPPVVDDNDIVQNYLDIDLNNLNNYANHVFPAHYDANILATDNSPSINEVTDMGATLGRVLFYDKNISLNNTVACASCHNQGKGFSDDRQLSDGFLGGKTGKHSMRLANANFYTGERMFWDKRAEDVEDQVTRPIQDAVEMGFDESVGGIDSLIRKMEGLEYYPILFENAFGSTEITEEKMQRALAQFVRSIVSTVSKFDAGFAQVFNAAQPNGGINANFPNFTAMENQGKNLFLAPPPTGAGCAGCHQVPTFALNSNSLSNGLDAGETTIFKSPSLKNIAVTGPYMHDGRFSTLEQVIEHYDNGVKEGPALDNRLRTPPGPGGGQPQMLNLSANEKQALVAFLNTLTDENLLTESKFSDPFIK